MRSPTRGSRRPRRGRRGATPASGPFSRYARARGSALSGPHSEQLQDDEQDLLITLDGLHVAPERVAVLELPDCLPRAEHVGRQAEPRVVHRLAPGRIRLDAGLVDQRLEADQVRDVEDIRSAQDRPLVEADAASRESSDWRAEAVEGVSAEAVEIRAA